MINSYLDYGDIDIVSWCESQFYDCTIKKSFQVQSVYVKEGDTFPVIHFDFETGIMRFWKDSEAQEPNFSVQFQMIPQGLVTNEQT